MKKSKRSSIILSLICIFILIGGVCGYFVSRKLTENDKFEIIGEKIIEVNIGESYTDEGAIAISFGKDVSDKIKTESNVDYTTEGVYYIKYSVDNLRFKGIERYRTIKVLGGNDEGI